MGTRETATETVIVGAGPAGLAVGACLRAAGRPFVMVDKAEAVGASWRGHYERLHLHTLKRYSGLPMMGFADDVPPYPSRAQVVAYLEAYARRFGLAPRLGVEVEEARRRGGGWEVRGGGEVLRARQLVVATGYNAVPNEPEWPGRGEYRGTLMHSRAYRNGRAFAGRRVLVVGIGNSGAEIAMDLWEHGARTAIAVRSPVHVIPRELWGVPSQRTGLLMGRLPPSWGDRISGTLLKVALGDLGRYGLRRPEVGPVTQVVRDGRVPLVDVGTLDLIRQGAIEVLPDVAGLTEGGARFVDGREEPFDAIVTATGYRPGFARFLHGAELVADARGYPRAHGRESALPGLYFLGFRNPIIGQLNDIGREARRVARDIAARAA